MMKRIIKYKKYIIGLAMVMMLSTLFFGINYLMKNKKDEPLPEVRLRKISKTKTFAIMVQNDDGYEEYTSEDDKWPGADYVFKEAKCTDNNGELVEDAITFADGKATLTTNQTIYCTLYFDEKPKNIEYLRAKDLSSNLSTDLQGGMYRYQGIDDVPNWICFGTTDKNQCTDETDSDGNNISDGIDKYMYRIIGITEEGQIYLIKETFIKEGETSGFYWNLKNLVSDCIGDTCEWPNVDLYKRLNGETSNGNPIFVNNGEYEYIVSGTEWYNLIEDHNWMYGDTNTTTDSVIYNGDAMYGIETGKTATKRWWPDEKQETCSSDSPCTEKDYTWSKSVNAKIGLMYIHDVDYAYPEGNPGSYTNIKNSWINFQKYGYYSPPNLPRYEWLISRFGLTSSVISSVTAILTSNDGLIMNLPTSGMDKSLGIRVGVRPTFYLSSKAIIESGSGTKTDPFILSF